MKFKTFQLIINDQDPTKEDIEFVAKSGILVYHHASNVFEISKSIFEDRFLWMSCEFDNDEIYNQMVLNEKTEKKEKNPRNKSQIECRYQLFVCYDSKEKLLYMNLMDKRNFLMKYLSDTLHKEVKIKNIISSLEDFQNAVKYIKKATFIQKRNLVNSSPNSIFTQTTNIYGLDAPENLLIKADYGNTPVGIIKNILQDFQTRKNKDEFESIIIVGEDDCGIEHSFDFSSIIKSIEIKTVKNQNGHFDSDEIRNLLLNEIR